MFGAIEAGMQNPNLDIALPSLAVPIVLGGSRNSYKGYKQCWTQLPGANQHSARQQKYKTGGELAAVCVQIPTNKE